MVTGSSEPPSTDNGSSELASTGNGSSEPASTVMGSSELAARRPTATRHRAERLPLEAADGSSEFEAAQNGRRTASRGMECRRLFLPSGGRARREDPSGSPRTILALRWLSVGFGRPRAAA
jgi:hypothetical protein